MDRILAEAARIFAERGYRATTTNDVAEAASVSIGSLYQYFPNKDALLAALAERHLDEAVPRLVELGARMDAEQPSPDALAAEVVATTLAVNDGPIHRLLHDAPRTAAINDRFDEITDMAVAGLAGHFRRFGQEAEVAEARARLAVLLLDAAAHDAQIGDPVIRSELVDAVASLADPVRRSDQVP